VDEFTVDEEWGMYDGQCAACDMWGRVNDLGLCEDCADKLERDLIRQRDWDYSASAFGLSADDREKLRRQIIARHGEKMELIAPRKQARKKRGKN
jgi:hypothetical protein